MSYNEFSENPAAATETPTETPVKTEPIRHILDDIGRYRKHSKPISQSGPPKVEEMKARDERLKTVAEKLKSE